jgi:two-component system, chemotaxis family, response regulator Rcp1
VFRLLIVDDNPADAELLRQLLKTLKRPYEAYYAIDGLDALDFLYCRNTYVNAPPPNLILLDINMPRMDGHEVLARLKSDQELSIIPIIMLSTSSSPDDIRKAYQLHANCYVPKPTTVDRAQKLIQAVEAFWMDVAVLSPCKERPRDHLGRLYRIELFRTASRRQHFFDVLPYRGEKLRQRRRRVNVRGTLGVVICPAKFASPPLPSASTDVHSTTAGSGPNPK